MNSMPTSAHYSKPALKLRHELREWLCAMTPSADAAVSRYSVTLTFDIKRMYELTPSGELPQMEKVAWVKRAFGEFRRRLDYAILGNAALRYILNRMQFIVFFGGTGIWGKQKH
jgi:hypothetical protein